MNLVCAVVQIEPINYANRAVNSEQGKAKEWLDRSLISVMLFFTRHCERKMFRERTFGQVARF